MNPRFDCQRFNKHRNKKDNWKLFSQQLLANAGFKRHCGSFGRFRASFRNDVLNQHSHQIYLEERQMNTIFFHSTFAFFVIAFKFIDQITSQHGVLLEVSWSKSLYENILKLLTWNNYLLTWISFFMLIS